MAETTARIVLTAEDKTAAALASLRAGLSGAVQQVTSLQGAFANLLPAVTFTAGFAFVKNINDGVDALNDFKDATGASIENASALEDVAVRTGTAFSTVTNAAVRFNQVLSDASTNEQVASVFRDLGLSVEELKRIDPAEALRRTAVALSGFADDGDKARRTQELFGRSLKEVAPFLNDLATQTELVGKVTAEQAAEAEKFNKQLAELQKNAVDVGRSITSVLVPAINQVFSDVRSFGSKSDLAGAAGEVVRLKKELDGLQQQRGSPLFPAAVIESRIEDITRRLEDAKSRFRELDSGRGADAAPAVAESRPSIGPGAAGVGGVDKAAQRRAEEARKSADIVAKALAEGEEEWQKELNEAQRLGAEFRLREEQAFFEASKEQRRQYFDFIDQQREEEERAAREAAGIFDGQARSIQQVDRVAQDLGFTFSSAFENAVIGGESFRNVLQGIGDDIARIILRRQVTEPLANAVSGIDFGSLFTANAKGGVYDSPSLSSFSGGVYSTPQVFAFAKGMGIFAEAGPEAIMPLARTSSGELGVRAMAGGGGANVVVNVIEAPGRGGEQSSRQEGDTRFIDIFVEQVESRMASRVQRGDGPLPVAMERTYGLNRSPGSY